MKIWMGLITIFVMVSSGLAIFADNINSNVRKYNDHKFKQVQMGQSFTWQLKMDGQKIDFLVHPADVETIKVDNGFAEIGKICLAC